LLQLTVFVKTMTFSTCEVHR